MPFRTLEMKNKKKHEQIYLWCMSFRVPVTNYNLSTVKGEKRIEPSNNINELFLSSLMQDRQINIWIFLARACVCIFFVSETTCKCMTTNHTHTINIFCTHTRTRSNWAKKENEPRTSLYTFCDTTEKNVSFKIWKEKMKKKWQKKHALPFKMANKKKETIICDLKLAKSLSRLWIRSFFMIYLSYSYSEIHFAYRHRHAHISQKNRVIRRHFHAH